MELRTQYAALPFTIRNGEPEVMLVTSRETGRWIIPKGWPETALSPEEVVAREAFEEAGLKGHVRRPLGSYHYRKRLKSGEEMPCFVETFLLEVDEELAEWPEKDQRQRRWLPIGQAAMEVSEPGLVGILLGLAVTA